MTVSRTKASAAGGVHRLVDMVVEEVSLVDHAANQRRFLLVKRDDEMSESQPGAATTAPSATSSTTTTSDATKATVVDAAWAVAEGSPLGAALGALESLTAIVELLGSLGAETNDTRLAALAQQLRATAEALLERTGFAEATGPAEPPAASSAVDVEARAKRTGSGKTLPASLAADVTGAKQALARLTEVVSKALPAKTASPSPSAAPPPPAAGVDVLAKLAESVHTLSESMKEQQQRLLHVEKQFGLPNSTRHIERPPVSSHDDDSWPLDLNHPQDKASVDKSLSFHDL